MNIKNIIILICLLLVWTACKKKKTEEAPVPKQYSTWIVNNHDTFRTNNVDSSVDCNPDHSYCQAVLTSLDSQNWFNIGFYSDFLPSTGQWPLANFIQIPSNESAYVFIYFYYKGLGGYMPLHPESDTLYITSINGKISYKLDATWFVNHNNLNDSILIQGVFNTP